MFYVFGPDGVVTNRNPREGGAKLLADFCGGTFKSDELTEAERAAVAEYEATVGKLTPRERYGLTEEAAAILLGEEAADDVPAHQLGPSFVPAEEGGTGPAGGFSYGHPANAPADYCNGCYGQTARGGVPFTCPTCRGAYQPNHPRYAARLKAGAGLGDYPPNDPDGMREFLLTPPEPGV